MKVCTLLFLFTVSCFPAAAQQTVYFTADDGLRIRGDLYLKNNQLPFILLCHQEGSNRSEFYEVAPRLLNLNYNCLAIDLRTGGKSGFIHNETATRAQAENLAPESLSATADIHAAIRFLQSISDQPVVIFGNGCSASLCFLVAAGNPRVKAIIAISPGEYFQPRKMISNEVKQIVQPVFATGSQTEYPYLQKMLSGIPVEQLTLFKPEKGKGKSGIGALYQTCENNGEYWFALMMFFKKIG